jgi:hypothetical protein
MLQSGHTCSQRCSFSFLPGSVVCRHSGRAHACTARGCLYEDPGSGHTVCTWTGLVSTSSNSRVDNTLQNNMGGKRDGECSAFGLVSIGYQIPGKRKAVRLGSSRRRDAPVKAATECTLVTGTVMVRCASRPRDAGGVQKRSAPRRAGTTPRKRDEMRRDGVSRPSVFAPSRVKPLVPAHAPNTQESRNAATAAEMVWCLYMNTEVRAAMRADSRQKCQRVWKARLRAAGRCGRRFASDTAVYRLWAAAHVETAGAWDISQAEPRPADGGDTPGQLPAMRVRTTVADEVCRELVQFLLDGWARLSRTALWQSEAPDFASFVMGALYAARDGGVTLAGYPIIQETAFFRRHTPGVQQLSTLCVCLELRDCRTTAYGRARIMEGLNAIRRTLLHEEQSGATAIPELAFAVPAALRRTYEDAQALTPWYQGG